MSEVAAIVLAAGRSSRYRAGGGAESSKLVALYRGEPLVRAAARAALASRASPVIAVTGHARAEVEAALEGLPVSFAHNPDFASGLASSLRAGLATVPPGAAGAIILLGDMPAISAAVVDALIAAFLARPDALAATPVYNGRRGNPVLLGWGLFEAISGLSGDEGARGLLRAVASERIVEVELADAAVTADIDTLEDLAAIAGKSQGLDRH